MEYRYLGASGLQVSEVSLGSWLTYGAGVDVDTAIDTIHRAYELGVNFFDTANVYARGAAEEIVGQVLRDLPRSRYVLATKVFWPMGDGVNERGLSRKHIIEQCNASLTRLGLDYVDLYYCHRYDPTVPLDETLRALEDLVRQGKVLYVGVSEWSAAQITDAIRLQEAIGYDRVIANQPRYNLLDRDIEEEIMPLCFEEGIGIVPFSPLAQGILTGKYAPGEAPPEGSRAAEREGGSLERRLHDDVLLARVQQLGSIAEGYGLSIPQLAIAWLLQHPEVSSALVGASRPSQIEENVGAAGVTLSDADLETIEELFGHNDQSDANR